MEYEQSTPGQRLRKALSYLGRGQVGPLARETAEFLYWKTHPELFIEEEPPEPEPPPALVPQIRKQITIEEFPFVQKYADNPAWSEAAIRERIMTLGKWEYEFQFAHGLSTKIYSTYNEASALQHRYRSKLISETVIELLGDDVGQSTVLDLACHNGVFSFDLAERGVKWVNGFDVRQRNIDKANFLREYYQILNTEFKVGDVYELPNRDLQADVVLCLGILYHVVRPVDLIEYCYKACTRFAVIDTNARQEPFPAYFLELGVNVDSSVEGTRTVEFVPTYQALVDTMLEAGFKHVIEVVGECDESVFLYSDGLRRCLIGFK